MLGTVNSDSNGSVEDLTHITSSFMQHCNATTQPLPSVAASISTATLRAQEIHEKDLLTNMDVWYLGCPSLQNFTMRTEFVPISKKQQEALCSVCEALDIGDCEEAYLENSLQDMLGVDSDANVVESNGIVDSEDPVGDFPKFSNGMVDDDDDDDANLDNAFEALRPLVTKSERLIVEHFNGKAFGKMTSRSAKDCIYEDVHPYVVQMWSQKLREKVDEGMLPKSEQQACKFLRQLAVNTYIAACSSGFAVTSGAQLFMSLLRSSRISFDLNRSTECWQAEASPQDERLSECEKLTSEFLVVREWWDIPPESEFRVFVKDGRITAVSQYFHLCYYPDLVASAEARKNIRTMISVFFSQVILPVLPCSNHLESRCGRDGKLKTDTFVMDVTLDLSGTTSRQVSIIELNPFIPSTSGCLFNWADQHDRSILEGQFLGSCALHSSYCAKCHLCSEAFVLRVAESPPEKDVLQYVVPSYRRIAEEWLLQYQARAKTDSPAAQ